MGIGISCDFRHISVADMEQKVLSATFEWRGQNSDNVIAYI